jgi:5-aminolevulinate synthase
METAILTAKQICPFLRSTSAAALKSGGLGMAKECPMLGSAMAMRSFSNSSVNHQPKESSPVRAQVVESKAKNGGFDYEAFYHQELEKKHKDKSYRYFNNINRLAQDFPKAHTADPDHQVNVWCSNDYLGMGRHPQVINAMKYVSTFRPCAFGNVALTLQVNLRHIWRWGRWYSKHCWQCSVASLSRKRIG